MRFCRQTVHCIWAHPNPPTPFVRTINTHTNIAIFRPIISCFLTNQLRRQVHLSLTITCATDRRQTIRVELWNCFTFGRRSRTLIDIDSRRSCQLVVLIFLCPNRPSNERRTCAGSCFDSVCVGGLGRSSLVVHRSNRPNFPGFTCSTEPRIGHFHAFLLVQLLSLRHSAPLLLAPAFFLFYFCFALRRPNWICTCLHKAPKSECQGQQKFIRASCETQLCTGRNGWRLLAKIISPFRNTIELAQAHNRVCMSFEKKKTF